MCRGVRNVQFFASTVAEEIGRIATTTVRPIMKQSVRPRIYSEFRRMAAEGWSSLPFITPSLKGLMGAQRIRKVKSRAEMDEIVDDFITQGYKVIGEGKSSVQLKRSEWGTASMHILILILLGCWTIGIANLIYALIANSNSERVLVKLVGGKNYDDDDEEEEEDDDD